MNESLLFQAPLQNLQWLHIFSAQEPYLAHVAGLYKLITLKEGLEKIKVPRVRGLVS